MGGIALILSIIAVGVLVAMVFGFIMLRGGTRSARRAADDGGQGRRPLHDVPHPEQAERERGTLFPS